MAPPDAPATSGEAALSSRHEVRVIDGRFCHAECSCGWRAAGRRLRSTARAEARDHALLYAGTEADTEATVDVRADTDQPQRTPAP